MQQKPLLVPNTWMKIKNTDGSTHGMAEGFETHTMAEGRKRASKAIFLPILNVEEVIMPELQVMKLTMERFYLPMCTTFLQMILACTTWPEI